MSFLKLKKMNINFGILNNLATEYGDSYYLLDSDTFRKNFRELKAAFSEIYSKFNIAYSYKTNYTPKLCKIVNELGEVLIDTDVIAKYAGTIAVECFGVVGMAAINMKDGLVKLLKKDSLSNGINVVVDEGGTVSDFHKDILAEHTAVRPRTEIRTMIVVEQVLADAGALRLPVGPDAHGAVMDVVPSHHHVDGRVQLDAGNLRAAQLLHVVDMMDMVILDQGEHRAHAAHDTGLLAVMDVAAAHDMAADLFLQPAVILSAANRVALHLGGALQVLGGKVVVVLRIIELDQCLTGLYKFFQFLFIKFFSGLIFIGNNKIRIYSCYYPLSMA